MPTRLKRFHQSGQTHFLTFSCYQRRPFLNAIESRLIFESALERVRLSFGLHVYGYVVMPEHVHLLISEPDGADGAPFKPSFGLSGGESPRTLADAIKSLKQGVSRRLIDEAEHFWQKRYYDFNVRDTSQFMEKLRYIHRNPVKRGLCERPEDWEWSSFRYYATGLTGCVEIESEWASRKRERAAGKLCPAVELLPHSSQKKA
ncbi:MAG: REP-associated tyrosine transposase [Acidobacteriaceae bacterium]